MLASVGYDQHTEIPAPLAAVWAVLVDPRQHVELHPLIRSLTITAEGEGPEPGERFCEFAVVDRVPVLGPLALPVRYRTRMIIDASRHQLRMQAHCPPKLVTDVCWTLSATAAGTRVDEQVELRAPRLIAGFSLNASKQAHAEMFAALRARFAGIAR